MHGEIDRFTVASLFWMNSSSWSSAKKLSSGLSRFFYSTSVSPSCKTGLTCYRWFTIGNFTVCCTELLEMHENFSSLKQYFCLKLSLLVKWMHENHFFFFFFFFFCFLTQMFSNQGQWIHLGVLVAIFSNTCSFWKQTVTSITSTIEGKNLVPGDIFSFL